MDRYNKKIGKLYSLASDPNLDSELYHIERDKVQRDFIKDVSTQKYNMETLVEISKMILFELKKNKEVAIWYA